LVEEGEIDTIIVAITDMQGRLQGKRLDASYSSTNWPTASSRVAATFSPPMSTCARLTASP